MATKTYLYRASGVTSADLIPLLAPTATPIVGVALNDALIPISIDELDKPDLDDAMASLQYDFVAEYTDPAPMVSRTDFGVRTSDPTGIVPNAGDYYYNSALQMEMRYDDFRSKWLSIETSEFQFGRDGNTAPGQYYRSLDGRVMSSTLGWLAVRSGTVVSFGYTRSNVTNATFDIHRNGVSLGSVVSSAVSGRDVVLNGDFSFGEVLSVQNLIGGNVTSNALGWVRVKWRP